MGLRRWSNLLERASFHLRKMVQRTITKPIEAATAMMTVKAVPEEVDVVPLVWGAVVEEALTTASTVAVLVLRLWPEEVSASVSC